MTNYQKILISVGLIVFNNILGHFAPPSSIFLTPIVLGATTILLATSSLNFPLRILLILLAIVTNDILIKFFAGGTHDSEGAGWINLFLIIGIVVSTITTFAIFIQKEKILKSLLACLIIPVALFFHLSHFDFLGLSYTQSESISEENSKKEGIFLKELSFSETQVFFNGDSIKLISGWIEKQRVVDHSGLIRRDSIGEQINYIIKVESNKSPYDSQLLYKVDSRDINGSSLIDSVIRFSSPKLSSSLFFFSLNNKAKDTFIKEIKVNSQ